MSKLKTAPYGWKLTTLGTFMEFKNGVNADKNAYGSGTEFVNVMDIFKRNFMKKCNILGKVEITEKQKAEYSVKYGDILFNRTSEVPDEIAQILNTAKQEIDLIKKTLEQYRSQKRGLMQKLLTGEWQVGSSQHLSEETCQELSREGVA